MGVNVSHILWMEGNQRRLRCFSRSSNGTGCTHPPCTTMLCLWMAARDREATSEVAGVRALLLHLGRKETSSVKGLPDYYCGNTLSSLRALQKHVSEFSCFFTGISQRVNAKIWGRVSEHLFREKVRNSKQTHTLGQLCSADMQP